MQRFFSIVEAKLKEAKKRDAAIDETRFVDNFISKGYKNASDVRGWEYEHQELRKEHGRETSFMKDDKIIEIVSILNKNPDESLDQINADLKTRGMSLGVIDKIYVLSSQKDDLILRIEHLLSLQKE